MDVNTGELGFKIFKIQLLISSISLILMILKLVGISLSWLVVLLPLLISFFGPLLISIFLLIFLGISILFTKGDKGSKLKKSLKKIFNFHDTKL